MKNVVIITGSRADLYHLQPLIDASGWDLVPAMFIPGPELEVDLAVILGDRHEMLQAAIALYARGIPIAHLHGGEQTLGSKDEGYRHCITKLSDLHFTATEEYRRRVIQLGESPDRVFNVGAIRFDGWRKSSLKFLETFDRPVGLVAMHFETEDWRSEMQVLANVINSRKDVYFMISSPTTPGDKRHEMFINRCRHGHVAEDSMGEDFLDILSECAFIIGNSSAGIIEAPHVQTPTINIGTRQKGRAAGCSVLHVPPDEKSIHGAINHCMGFNFQYEDLYYQGGAVDKIIEVINNYEPETKVFYDCLPRDFKP